MELTKKRLVIGAIVLVVGSFVVQKVFFPSDERRIERTIERFETGSNPSHCDERATDAYLEQMTGAVVPFADEACESESLGPATDSVDVSEISVNGHHATALVAYSGGYFGGSVSKLRLVQADGDWKIDRRLSFAHFDRGAFRHAYRESFREFGSPEDRVRCALAREAELSDAEIQRSILEQSGAVFTRIAVACDRAGVEREVRASLARGGLSSVGTECVERRLAAVSDARLVGMQVDLAIYGRLATDCDRDAIVRFARRESIAGDDDREETACLVGALRGLSPIRQFRLTYEDDRYGALYRRCEG